MSNRVLFYIKIEHLFSFNKKGGNEVKNISCRQNNLVNTCKINDILYIERPIPSHYIKHKKFKCICIDSRLSQKNKEREFSNQLFNFL